MAKAETDGPADESKCGHCGTAASAAAERNTKDGPQLVCPCGYVYSEASKELRSKAEKRSRGGL